MTWEGAVVDPSSIGFELKPVTFPVERGKIREFARAIRAENPVYLESECPPAPLTFTRTFLHWGDALLDAYLELGVDVTRTVHGGQEFEYLARVCAGDVLTMTGKLVDVYTKQGAKGGSLQFIVFEWTYTNQHGAVAVRSRNTTIVTSRAVRERV